jgi:hypothetical protein
MYHPCQLFGQRRIGGVDNRRPATERLADGRFHVLNDYVSNVALVIIPSVIYRN